MKAIYEESPDPEGEVIKNKECLRQYMKEYEDEEWYFLCNIHP
jgi:hypothetical protein